MPDEAPKKPEYRKYHKPKTVQRNSPVEEKYPDQIADTLLGVTERGPEASMFAAAVAAGLPTSIANTLQKKLKERYPAAQELIQPLANADLSKQIQKQIGWIDGYLTQAKFTEKLEKASFKDLMIGQGILMDKDLVLRGQPSVIVGQQEQRKLDELAPALLEEIKRRGIKATATERTVEIEVPPA